MPSADWTDIQIVGADESRTHNPNPQLGIYHVYLQLSATPPHQWVEFFEAERGFPRHSMWRRAWIEGNCIVIACGLDEIKRYHLADLREDVQKSNTLYRQFLVQQDLQRARQAQQETEERKRVKSALSDLDF